MSDISTPRKKRKLPVTWSYLCRDIGDEDQKKLAVALLEGAEDAELFAQNSAIAQNAILKGVLGDGSEMVPLVLKNAEQVRSGVIPQMTVVQKVQSTTLPPSQKLTAAEVANVSDFIFGWDIPDKTNLIYVIRNILARETTIIPEQVQPTAPLQKESLERWHLLFKEFELGTRLLGIKEASGYPQLATYLMLIRSILGQLKPGVEFNADFQYEILGNFHADGAMIVCEDKPVYIVEYKARVPTHLDDIEPYHLSQVFLQAFYVQKKFRYPILHVLTDLRDFHCFLMKERDLMKYFCFRSNLTDKENMLTHSCLICDVLMDAISTLTSTST